MHKEHLIFCGGVPLEGRRGVGVHELRLGKDEKQGQIRLDTESITKKMIANLPPVLHDLLEVATYVYVADQVISRGGPRHLDYGDNWNTTLGLPTTSRDSWKRRYPSCRETRALSTLSRRKPQGFLRF
jgi:hypothetical protein